MSNLWNSIAHSVVLIDMPPEILLHIFSYLDLPDLWTLSSLNSPLIDSLTADPVLHYQRRWLVYPSRVNHALFGKSKEGHLLRPSVLDLVRRGVMRGLGLERRWRMGLYIYSLDSILQYENSRRLSLRHAQQSLTVQLARRTTSSISAGSGPKKPKVKFNPKVHLLSLHSVHILPDIEISSTSLARSLLPTVRKLKWCLQRDRLAREFKRCGKAAGVGLGKWLSEVDEVEKDVEKRRMRNRIFVDAEKVRLALCPDVKRLVGFFEGSIV